MKRPLFLTIWLTLIIISDLISLYYVLVVQTMQRASMVLPWWFTPTVVILSISELIGVYYLWDFKKIGMYFYISATVLNMIITYILFGGGAAVSGVIFGLIGIVILYMALRPVWYKFT